MLTMLPLTIGKICNKMFFKKTCKGVLEMWKGRDCKSKAPNKGKGYDDAPSGEVKTTSNEAGDVYMASSSNTHVDHEA